MKVLIDCYERLLKDEITSLRYEHLSMLPLASPGPPLLASNHSPTVVPSVQDTYQEEVPTNQGSAPAKDLLEVHASSRGRRRRLP